MENKENDFEQLELADAWITQQENLTVDSAELVDWDNNVDEFFYIDWKDDSRLFNYHYEEIWLRD